MVQEAMLQALTARGEDLFARVFHQVQYGLDRDRLQGDLEKRRREVEKKLDRGLLEHKGWYTFVSGQAYTIANGKAPAKRNSEIMLVEQVSRWVEEVKDACPDRMGDLVQILREAMANPTAVTHNR